MENKAAVAKAFGEVLKMTRDYRDLKSLVYTKNGHGEYVYATFNNGTQKVANVHLDSEVAMIADIMKQIIQV